MRRTALLCFLSLSVGVSAHGATVQKWVDAAGRVHYGDRPPAQGPAVELVLEGGGAGESEPGLRPGERELLDNYHRRRRHERKRREQALERRSEETEERRKACAKLARELRNLDNGDSRTASDIARERNELGCGYL